MKKIKLAGCVIADDYGRILLVHRNTDQFHHWELPGGKVEKDETAEAAAVREIYEELGVQARLVRTLGSDDCVDENGDFHFLWFQAVIVSGTPKLQETDKFDDFDYFDLEDLMSLALSANMQVLYPKLASGEIPLNI
ncbi:MAG TPA: NUDIX hydrolase [Candidatus Saccharimonadales bacterium]|nr:NUDIX hydrolase [Candidatus Saccharimonadales bacterium]